MLADEPILHLLPAAQNTVAFLISLAPFVSDLLVLSVTGSPLDSSRLLFPRNAYPPVSGFSLTR